MDFTRFSILFLLLKLSALVVVDGKDNDLTVELDSFEVSKQYDTKFIDWKTLRMKKAGHNQFVLNGTIIINLNIGNEQRLNLQIHKYDGERKIKGPLIYNLEKEICKFMAEDKDIYPGLKEVSNLPESDVCPLPKGNYDIKEYQFKADFLPHDTPKGDYLIIAKLKNGATPVAAVEIYIIVS